MFVVRFPVFLFFKGPLFIVRLFPRVLDLTEDRCAVGLHARMLFVPLFRDTSYVGRFLSAIFRISRVVTGIFLVLFALTCLGLVFALWLIFPFLVIIYGGWLGILALLFAWLGYTLFIANRPQREISHQDNLDTISQVATVSTQRVLGHPGTPVEYIDRLIGFGHTQAILAKMGIDKDYFYGEVKKRARKTGKRLGADQVYQVALKHARELKHQHVTVADVFLALSELSSEVAESLFKSGLSVDEAKAVVAWMDRQWQLEHPPRFWDRDYQMKRLGGVNRAWTARPTPNLNRLGVDLTLEAQRGRAPHLVGREEVIREIVQILSRASRDNVLIVGPAGSGKTTLVSGLAFWIIEGGVDPSLFSKRIVRLDVPQLIAGAEAQGELEKRIIEVMKEVQEAGNVILFIDQIHTLAAAGTGTDALNVFSTFEPYLASSEFQVIGATSWLNYRRYIEPQEAFARMFQLVELPEADKKDTLKILEVATVELERKNKVTISYKALRAAYQLSERYLHDRVQPDKALDILEETAVMVSRSRPKGAVTYQDIGQVVSQKTEIPVSEVTAEESAKLLTIEDKLHQRVIGQDQAIRAIGDALRRARVGLREENRPIAALLFVGPTGVGKTEMAKALAEAYFGSESAMIRLDMSEYQTPQSVASLIGPPPGPTGVPVPGRLTEAIRRRPFALVLLDELEKAHPDILNLFLQVIEDGRLTDGAGRTVKFDNSILIATSNAGTHLFAQAVKERMTEAQLTNKLHEELNRYFRPELLNRFDGIILCSALSREELLEVVRLKLSKIKKQMESKDIQIEFTEPLVEALAEKGYDPLLGARPLRRLLQDTLGSYLAKRMLSREVARGDLVRLGPEILEKI